MVAISNRREGHSRLAYALTKGIECRHGNYGAKSILPINRKKGTATPVLLPGRCWLRYAGLDPSNQPREAQQTMRRMATQLGLKEKVGLNRREIRQNAGSD